jgi:hypothetical protein
MAYSEATKNATWEPTIQIRAVSCILKEIIEENLMDTDFKENFERQKNYSYNSNKPASISIENYLERIVKYTKVEESTLVTALIYIDRLCETTDVILTQSNVHR